MAAGTTIPPSAAMAGSATLLRSDSSPATTSRLISSPTSRKKIAISRSLIQISRVLSSLNAPTCSLIGVCRNVWYSS